MIRINLIPVPDGPRAQPGRSFHLPLPTLGWLPRSPGLAAAALGFVLLLLTIFLYYGERRAISDVRAAIVHAQADSARLHRTFARVRAMEGTQRQLAARLERLDAVIADRDYWIRFMEAVSETLPPYTWLEGIDRTDLPADRVRIEGATFAAAAVTEYMRELEASSVLAGVELVGVARSERDSFTVQGFTLIAALEGYEPVDFGAGEEEEQ